MAAGKEMKAMATALSLMEHLPVMNYGECRATLKQVRLVLNDQYASLWGRSLPVTHERIDAPDLKTAGHRIQFVFELIRYMPVDSFPETAGLLDALDTALRATIGQIAADALWHPFRGSPRIATDNGSRVVLFGDDRMGDGETKAASA